jgi:uncharacterized repeat protein (TIGR01451 family)
MRRLAKFWVLQVLLLPIIVKAELPPSKDIETIAALHSRAPDRAAPLVLPDPVAGSRLRAAARSRIPAGFVENQGQVDDEVKFYVRAGRQTLWLTQNGLVFDLTRTTVSDRPPGEEGRARPPTTTHERIVFAQEYLGRNVGGSLTPEQLIPGVHNFLLGADPSKWRTGLRAYADVVYHDVWDRIDLRVSHRERAVEQEFVVKPGGDPSRIRVAYRGTEGLRIDEDGSLVVRTAFGELRESPPTIYQEIDGRRVTVTGRFKLLGTNSYAFEVDAYERRYALVIDPTLAYATYLGGGADEDPLGQNIAVDGVGNVYVAGATTSSNFPATLAGSVYSGGTGLLNGGPGGDVFVAKLNPAGSALVYAIYLGGSGDEAASGLAVDSAGSVYLSGSTTSTDFPITPGAFQTTRRTSLSQGFVVKLNSAGNGLVYSTYLGGSLGEQGGGIAVDSAGHAYVTGITGSSDFPMLNSLQPLRGVGDVFITKLTPDGSGLVYSTLLGGATLPPSPPPPPGAGATQWGKSIAVDATDQAYVAGYTTATDYPRANADQSTLGGGLEAFVTKLKADGTLAYSTYLGGSGDEQGLGIAVDTIGNAYVTGTTASVDFPTTAGAYQTAPKPGSTSNAFVTKLSPAGAKVYSTYLGGSAGGGGYGVAVDALGIAYVTGFNSSGDFPTLDAFQPVQGSGFNGFVTALTPSGSQLVHSSFLGGAGRGIAVDASGQVYVAGVTNFGANIPTNFMSYGGGQDAFVVKVNAPSADVSVTKFGNPNPVLSLGSLTYTITVRNAGPDTAVNIALTDTVPTGTTFQSLTPSTGCTTPSVGGTGVVICSIGDLGPGESKELDLVVQVAAASGSVTNIAAVAAATSDPTPGNNSATVVTPVSAAGSISGTVCAGAAPPCVVGVNPAIAGALINVSNTSTGFTLASAVTDAAGFFQIDGLAPGNYRVTARAAGFATRWFNNQLSFGAATTVTVNGGAITPNISFGLPGNSGGIGGKVTLSDGVTPVANASISIRTLSSDFVLGVVTDASGNYNTGRILGAGNYLVRASAPGLPPVYFDGAKSAATARPVAVVGNADTPNINIRLSQAVGGISGRVTSATTGAPLAAINVSLFDGATGGLVQVFTTDATGHYDTALSLAPGLYKVTASVAGSATVAYNNKFSAATGDPVTVTAGATTPGIDLALPLFGALTGHVTNAQTGAPLQGVSVGVFDYATNNFITNTPTAADGSYIISGLNPLQAYRVQARLAGFGVVYANNKGLAATADIVTVPAASSTTLDFALGQGGGITGRVTDAATLAGIQGIIIDIFDGTSTAFSVTSNQNLTPGVSTTTDASGNFNTGRVLAPGTYKVRARFGNVATAYLPAFYVTGLDLTTATPVTVTAGADTPNVNIALSKGGTITGTIRDRATGLPIANAGVAAQRFSASIQFLNAAATTDANGNFTISGLTPGEWVLGARATGHVLAWYSGDPNNPATDFSSSTTIPITGASTFTGADISLQLGGGAIQGRVTRSDTGQPVPIGSSVAIRGPVPRISALSIATGITTLTTDAQGSYSYSGLPAGQYAIEVFSNQVPNGTVNGFYPLGAISRGTAVPISVTDGETSVADFQVPGLTGGESPRIIRGIIRDPNNNPIRDAFVFAYEPNALTTMRVNYGFDDGSFAMNGLPPGKYLIAAQTEKTFVATTYPAEIARATGVLVDVTAGDVSGINIVLADNAGTITGRITRSDNGQPVLGALITVLTPSGASVGVTPASRVDGTYLARGLAPGFYKVGVSAPGLVTKFFSVSVPGGVRTREDGSFVDVAAGTNTPGIDVALDPTTAVLTGTVKRQGTLAPVAGAVVELHDAATGNHVVTINSDASGAWRTEAVAAGSYTAEAFDLRDARYAAQWFNGKATSLTADPIAVAGLTGGVDFLVSANQGSISGRVFLSNGTTPLAGASVEILDAVTGGLVRRGATGSDGRYTVEGLSPAVKLYAARALALGFAEQYYLGVTTRAAATRLTVTSGGDTPNVNFTLTQPATADLSITKFVNPSSALSGANLTYTITVANAGPGAATGVSLLDAVPAGTTFQSVSPNAGCATPVVNGTGTVSCTIGVLGNGASAIYTLVVKVTAASGSIANTASVGALTADSNSANNTASVTTNVVAAGVITGIVTQGTGAPTPGTAIAGAVVTVYNSDNSVPLTSTVTDAGGNYTVSGLYPRAYKVSAQATGFAPRAFNNQATLLAGNTVTVNAGATTGGVNIALPGNSGTISGKVTLTDGVTPVSGATVNVRTSPAGDVILYTSTDPSGNYAASLAAGTYIVRAVAPGLAVTYYANAANSATATPVTVTANAATTNINIQMASTVGGISGRITSAATGAPLTNAGVLVFDGVTSSLVNAYSTDAAGRYDTGRVLRPGVYKVQANITGAETTVYNNKFSVNTADPVSVSAGNTTADIDIALPVLGGITGHVTQAVGGAPIAGAVVDVWDYFSNVFLTSATTAADGSYTINGLNPLQAYRVRGRAANFGMVFHSGKPSAEAADVARVPAGGLLTIDFALAAAGGIIGRVVDADTLAGIATASIDLVDGASPNFAINNFLNFAITTDASGNFNTGRVLPPGVYKLRARKLNSGYIQSFYPTGFDLSTAQTVTVVAGQDMTLPASPAFAMTMGGTITGTIRDRVSGQPIANAAVAAQRVASSNFFADNLVTTNASGVFTITGLHPGEYLIMVVERAHILGYFSGVGHANSPAIDFGTALPIQIAGASTVSGVDVNLQPGGGEIRGRVTRHDNGQPITPGTDVNIRGPWPRTNSVWNFVGGTSGTPPFTLNTDGQGGYSFSGLAPGKYIIEANRFQIANGSATGFYPFGSVSRNSALPVTVTDGGVSTADFQVFGFSGGVAPRAIRGTLRDPSNNPIRNAFVQVYEPNANGFVRTGTVFDDGSFIVDGLAPGRYLLSANTETTFATTLFPAELTLNTATVLDLISGDVNGLNLVLANTAGTITGTVTRSDTGQPVLGASISVRTFVDAALPGATSRVDGTYLVRGLTPGSYKVRVSTPGFVTKFFVVGAPGGARTLEDGSFVTVTASANTPNINVVLDPTAGALTGMVKDQSTLQPVAATVVAIDDAATGARVQVVSTDVNGSWITEGLGAGTYKVAARDVQASRHATQWYSAKPHQLVADTVTVAAVGTTGGIDMLVSQVQGSISGSVHLSNGTTPLPSAVVEILDAATGGLVRRAITGSDGRYSVVGLAPGNGLYFARARALGFAEQFFPSMAPTRADATALTVASGADTGDVNFNLTQSSDISGTITYTGSQSGALRVRLYSDTALTKQVYEAVVASPGLGTGQPYRFAFAAPDTRGLLPGTYYLKAFVDGNGNGFQDATEAFGRLGAPDAILVLENADITGKNLTLADPPATTNTPPAADAQTVIFVQGSSNNSIVLTGSDAQTATVNLTYSVVANPLHGTLAAGAGPQQRLYTPAVGFTGNDTFSFTVTDRGDPDGCGTPGPVCSSALSSAPATVTIQVNPTAGTTSTALSRPTIPGPSAGFAVGSVEIRENATGVLQAGSAIKLGLPLGSTFRGTPVVSLNTSNGASPGAAFLESASVASFTLATPSTTGPATILISGIFVDVGAEFLLDGVTSAALLTTISGPNPGLTSATVQNATIVSAEAGPAVTSAAPSTVAKGATGRIITITGVNFATNATVSFGSGVTVVSATVDNPNQITATLNIEAGAAGKRDLVVTNPTTGQSVTQSNALEINAALPTVSAVTGPLTHCENQLVSIQGTGFQAPTTTPSDLFVVFAPVGLTVTNVGYSTPTGITAIVDVAAGAANSTYSVTVTNPDGGVATLAAAVSVVSSACEAAPPPKGQPAPPPPPPSISSLSSASGPIGSALTINGAGFSGTPSVTFAGAGGTRVAATVTSATSTAINAVVPSGATSGNVTVSVNGLLSNAVSFSVTTPVLGAVVPGTLTTSANTVTQANLVLSGTRFVPGATVSFGGPASDVTIVGSPIVAADGTSISLTVTVPPTPQQTGPRDVTVTNPGGCAPPAPAGCLSSTLTGGLVIQLPPVASLTISLVEFRANPADYLPTVAQMSMTRLATGACNPATKVVMPGSVTLEATFASATGLPAPQSVTFSIVSSALPGTASNEDCEVDPSHPTKDFSVGAATPISQQVVVNNTGGGTYRTTLYSYDSGGKVTITVTGTSGGTAVTGTLTLPVDTDGDDLPDAYENNLALNRNVVTGLNVLDFQNPDKNGNGVKDRDDRFVKDGLTNFEKYRGYYMVGPASGASGAFGAFERLGAGVRHFFVRGRGFRDDPAVPAGSCGINPSTGAPVPDATLSAGNPCPTFQIGDAFKNVGIAVHNVSGSFAPATELPRASLVNPNVKTLDMATIVYDGVGCKGTEACDTTSKLGVRNWVFNTLGYTTPIGTATTYGSLSVFKRAVESYFNNRPYQHRTNDPARVLAAPDGTAMLAPVNIVGDSAVPGADNGRADTGDVLLNGQLVGDTYIPGSFNQHLSSFDVNNDGCVEAPTVADPTSIQRCVPAAETAPTPSATKQQVVRSIVTHELGHAVGLSHTADVTDIMYQATINFTRDGHFSDAAVGLIQIHNKGQQ